MEVADQLSKIKSLQDALLFIIAILIAVVVYLWKENKDLQKEMKELKDNVIRNLERRIERYENR